MTQPTKYLALDVSKNRVGFAVNLGGLVFGRGSFERRKHVRDLQTVLDKLKEQQAHALVLGLPLRTDGQPSVSAQRVRSFGFDLVRLGAQVYYQDERFSTRRARELGAPDLDEAAAVEILTLFLQRAGGNING